MKDLLVEGADANAGVVEQVVRRGNGNAELAIRVEAPFAAGVDWRGRVRDALAASARKRAPSP